MNPFELFNECFTEELELTSVRIPSACCLSTIGTDGFPNSRFVSLKEIMDDKFIITGPLYSKKAVEMEKSNKVSLTFWWTQTEKQIRIQGNASKISDLLADKYFYERGRDSQIVSVVSEQGEEIEDLEDFKEKYERTKLLHENQIILRPNNWGGFSIDPIRIEFMEFKNTRFHDRKLFEKKDDQWTIKKIQP